MSRPCLDCGNLIPSGSRCAACQRPVEAARAASGRQRRGPGWNGRSARLRAGWAAEGRSCVDAADGRCRGAVQADHVVAGSTAGGFEPRCLFHNASKGAR